MFVRGNDDIAAPGQQQAEDVFGVVRDMRRITAAPLGKNLEAVGDLPVLRPVAVGVDPRFFGHFAAGRGDQGFVGLAAARDRLPEAGMGGTFEQQNFIAVKNDGNGELTINGGSGATTLYPLVTGTVTTAGFDVYGDAGQNLTFYWSAIGS